MALCTIEVASRSDVTGGPNALRGCGVRAISRLRCGLALVLATIVRLRGGRHRLLDYSAGLWPALGATPVRTVAVTVLIGAIALVNVRGIVQGALMTNLLTIVKGLPLVLLAVAGLWLGGWAWLPSEGPSSLDALGGGWA